MTDVQETLVRAFLARLVNGSALDDCGNTDDDSMFMLAQRANSPYLEQKLNRIGVCALRLLQSISPPDA